MGKLSGRRILITGASRGIGYETVRLFTGLGAEMLGVARDEAKLKSMESEFKGFSGLAGDIGDKRLGGRLAEAVEKRWGALDLLINNAAVQKYNQGFHDEPVEMLEEHFKLNVLSAHWLSHALVPLLKKGKEPRIIHVSSGAGIQDVLKKEPTMPSYRLTKYALGGLTLLQAGDLKGVVAVNALDPGWLKTDLGGPNAPGEPRDGAERMLELALMSFEVTGRFWHGSKELPF